MRLLSKRPWAALRALVSTFRHSTRRTPATSRPGLETLEGRWAPATVTTLADAGPGSLRDALASTPAGGTVDFQPGLSGTITLTSANLTIDHDLTIAGPGANILAVSGNHVEWQSGGVFSVATGVRAIIDGLTISNGVANAGGGVFNQGTLTISNCTITGNSAVPLTDISYHPAYGGGIYNSSGIDNSSAGTLTMVRCTVANNTSTDTGGGIFAYGNLTIVDSTITHNTSSGGILADFGGGLLVSGNATITNSTITYNSAGLGGGLQNNGILTVIDSTIANNVATDIGPGGGGIYNTDTVNVVNGTIASNSAASGQGGGIDNFSNGTVALTNALIAGNSAASGPDVFGTVGMGFNNLIGDASGSSGLTAGVNGNQVGSATHPIDPLLGPLRNNGGPTLTMALLPGSPAIDAGTDSVGLHTDQRGFPRPARTHTDIGAYEYQATPADERFVKALYLDVLGRAGSPAEWSDWLDGLTGPGGSRTAVASGIEGSFEARDRVVKGWYQTFLGRQAQGGEEMGWVSLLAGQPEEQVLAEILGDPVGHEFFDRAQSLIATGTPDERFVQALYKLLLGRTGSSGEVAGWTAMLNGLGAAGRPGVVLGFLDSTEYRGDVVAGYYSTLLKRTASPEEVNGWVFSGLDLRAVRIAIEASPEYYAGS